MALDNNCPGMKSTNNEKIPVVYSPKYNISFFGLENILHSFDSKKYGKVFENLSSHYHFNLSDCYEPLPLTKTQLLSIHTQKYLNSFNSSYNIAVIAEIPLLAIMPNFLLHWRMLNPMKLATSGTVLAAKLALSHGWSVNMSGGYHHAKVDRGSGFCYFADIPLAIDELFKCHSEQVKTVLIVDLDAHQGNGFQAIHTVKDFDVPNLSSASSEEQVLTYRRDPRVHTLDMYNGDIYPGDSFAKSFTTYDLPLRSSTADKAYMATLRKNLPRALAETCPDVVFYNAGTDIFEQDSLGRLSISADGVVARDEFVFKACRERGVPVVMTLSGGYTAESAAIIARSLRNLVDKGVIDLRPVQKETQEQRDRA